ncbi:MAG: hypothetical protein NT062_14955 [Proteobacteria bacterium]|nr:hypothetical protein [Pseudomonadota bacterium]
MARFALLLGILAIGCAAVPSPGLYLAIGGGIGAIGLGMGEYPRRELPGRLRLAAAAAITLGCLGLLLGAARAVVVLAAIGHVERMLG